MFRKILVPLDGSQLAERALGPALALARHDEAEVMLTRVPVAAQMFIPAEGGYGLLYPEQSTGESREEAHQYLAQIAAAQAERGLKLRVLVAEGDVAASVADTARHEGADLIVMSSHGYSGLTRWLLGSVAEKVLHDAPCPVLVVRSAQPMQHVLVALDGSKLAERSVAQAFRVAHKLGARVTLLRVVPQPNEAALQEMGRYDPDLAERLPRTATQEAQAYLEAVAHEHTRPGMDVNAVVQSGPPATTLLKFAEQNQVDLIAMATHGRTGLRRWIYGSVTEKVLHAAHVSLLVTRPASEELR
jgi:nucleotide-binding universal stress UspA family protein